MMISITPLFAAFVLGLASYSPSFGTLQIIEMNTPNPISKTLIISENKVMTSEFMSSFSLDSSRNLSSFSGLSYVDVDTKGKLVLSEALEMGLQVAEEPNIENLREVSYRGDSIFQVCDDGSVAYNSNCSGARTAKIFYDDFFN